MASILERPIRKFNPGTFQSDEEVVEQFVVRKHECDTILDVLRDNIGSPSCQHTLITAPRGRGKTMLLARIAAEIRTKNEFSEHLMPVRFMEENQEISNIADFWLETLFHLARETAAQHPALAAQLRSTYEDLSRQWREQSLEERVRAAVLDTADQLGKKLVLMVENLQSLENLDKDFGWKLRAILQSEPQVILLASATNRFKGLDDASQPFFELFRIIDLEPLTTEECGCLWQVISGDSVREREIRPLQILTGGNPRLLVIIAGFTQHRSLRQLMEELVTLIDEHTEYFRGHLEVLAKTERRVYVAVLDLWQPSKPGEIAERARMDVRTVSTMLGRLINRGAVIVEGSGKKRLYSAVERLYSIYYKLRRERDEAAVVQNLIRFIVTFYSEKEQTEIFHSLIRDMAKSAVIHEGLRRAATEHPQIKSLYSNHLELQVAGTLIEKGRERKQLNDFEGAVAAWDEVVVRFGASDDRNIQQTVATALYLKGNSLGGLDNCKTAIAIYDELVERFGDIDTTDIQWWVAAALIGKGEKLGKINDFDAAIAVYDEVVERFGSSSTPKIQGWIAAALVDKGKALENLDNLDAAIVVYDQVVTQFSAEIVPNIQQTVSIALFEKGNALSKLGELEAAISAYAAVVERFGASEVPDIQRWVAAAFVHEGNALAKLGDYTAAITTCDEFVGRFGTSSARDMQMWVAQALSDKSKCLIRLKNVHKALEICEELEQRLGKYLSGEEGNIFRWRVMCLRTEALQLQGETQAALEAFHLAYTAFMPDVETMMQEMISIVPDLITSGLSEYDLVNILSSDSAKSATLEPLVIALRQNAGESVRAPAEILEVAEDIRNQINEKRLQKSARKELTDRMAGN